MGSLFPLPLSVTAQGSMRIPQPPQSVTRPPCPLPCLGTPPLRAWCCALNSPIKRHPVSVPSVSPLSASPPLGVGRALWPYLPCDQAWVPRGGCCLAPSPLICLCPVGPGTAMDSQLLPVLLLLLLRASGPRGQGPGTEGPSGEPPEEGVSEEDGVLVLSRHTLSLALREHPALLVEFCECTGSAGLGVPQGPPSEFDPSHTRVLGLIHLRGSSQWILGLTVLLGLHWRAPETEP